MSVNGWRGMAVWLQVLLAAAVLAAGGTVYLLFRPRSLLLFRVVDALRLTDAVGRWREATAGIILPQWVVYCLPDALWTTAYLLLIDALLRPTPPRRRLPYTAVLPAVGLASEGLQAVGLLPGTFDWLDLLAYTLPLALYIVVTIIRIRA